MNGYGRVMYQPYPAGAPMDGMYCVPMRWPNQQYPQHAMGQAFPVQESMVEDGYPYTRHNTASHQQDYDNMSKKSSIEAQLINKMLEKLGPVSTITKEEIDDILAENAKLIGKLNKCNSSGRSYPTADVAKLQRNLAFLSQLSGPII